MYEKGRVKPQRGSYTPRCRQANTIRKSTIGRDVSQATNQLTSALEYTRRVYLPQLRIRPIMVCDSGAGFVFACVAHGALSLWLSRLFWLD